MLGILDGEQKLSDWPKDALEHIKANPNNSIAVSQSTRSKHKLLATRLMGKSLFIGYNKKMQCFAAWELAPALLGLHPHDDVYLKISKRNLENYKKNPVFTAFSEKRFRNGKLIAEQKIWVFPEHNFIDFYNNYETYL